MPPKFVGMLLYFTLLSMLWFSSAAQNSHDNAVADSLFSGVWKGTSLCQVKNSSCHDENVVFYIAKTNKENIIEITANKIVNGTEEEMGKIQFRYKAETKQMISVSSPNAIWQFKREQNLLKGTLYYNNTLFRIIQLTKV